MQFINSVLSWVWLHMPQITATVTVLVMLLRAVPVERWQVLEQDWPRFANLLRTLRAIFPDLVKATKAFVLIWTGKPWPATDIAAPTPTIVPPPKKDTNDESTK